MSSTAPKQKWDSVGYMKRHELQLKEFYPQMLNSFSISMYNPGEFVPQLFYNLVLIVICDTESPLKSWLLKFLCFGNCLLLTVFSNVLRIFFPFSQILGASAYSNAHLVLYLKLSYSSFLLIIFSNLGVERKYFQEMLAWNIISIRPKPANRNLNFNSTRNISRSFAEISFVFLKNFCYKALQASRILHMLRHKSSFLHMCLMLLFLIEPCSFPSLYTHPCIVLEEATRNL